MLLTLTPVSSNPIGAAVDAVARRYRYHDPVIGRFTSFDSFEAAPGDPTHLHKYNYAGGDPINRVDPSGHDWTFGSVLTTSGIIAGFTAIGAAAGYKITGTVRGAMWGALGGAANGTILALYKGKGLIKANLLGFAAGMIATIDASDASRRGESDETEQEAFVRGYSSAVAAAAATTVVSDKLAPVMAKWLGDPDIATSVMSGTITELGTAAVTGNLWQHPWRTVSNIIVNAGVSYATKRFGGFATPYYREAEARKLAENTMASVAGWAAARWNDLGHDLYKYFGPDGD